MKEHVAPASLQWQRHLLMSMQGWLTTGSQVRLSRRRLSLFPVRTSHKHRRRQLRLSAYAALSSLMLLWDWKLLVATLAGVGAVLVLPKLQRYRWQPILQGLLRFWHSPHRSLSLSVLGGGSIAALTYFAIEIWVETQSHWLAAGVILQGLCLALGLGFGVAQLIQQGQVQSERSLRRHLLALTDAEPIQRLSALHALTQTLQQGRLTPDQSHLIKDVLMLKLNQEQDPILRNAVISGLAALRPHVHASHSGRRAQFPTI